MDKKQTIDKMENGWGPIYKAVFCNPQISLAAKALYLVYCVCLGMHSEDIREAKFIPKQDGKYGIKKILGWGDKQFRKAQNELKQNKVIVTHQPIVNGRKAKNIVRITHYKDSGYGMLSKTVATERGLTWQARVIYAYLALYANDERIAWPKQKDACYHLDITHNTWRKYVEELTDKGYVISLERGRQGNGKFETLQYMLPDRIPASVSNGDDSATIEPHTNRAGTAGAGTARAGTAGAGTARAGTNTKPRITMPSTTMPSRSTGPAGDAEERRCEVAGDVASVAFETALKELGADSSAHKYAEVLEHTDIEALREKCCSKYMQAQMKKQAQGDKIKYPKAYMQRIICGELCNNQNAPRGSAAQYGGTPNAADARACYARLAAEEEKAEKEQRLCDSAAGEAADHDEKNHDPCGEGDC